MHTILSAAVPLKVAQQGEQAASELETARAIKHQDRARASLS